MPTINIRNVSAGRWSLTPSGGGASFTVFGSQSNAAWWAARLELTYRSLGVQMAASQLGGRDIVLINSADGPRGSFVAQHGREPSGVISNRSGPDGTIYINVDTNEQNATFWGNSQLGEVAAILGHEILHAAYGRHAWGQGRPPNWQAVYADRYYEQQFSHAAELQLSFSINVTELGYSRGDFVVSEYGLRVPAGRIQRDANNRRYYNVSINGATRTYYVVDHDTYLKFGAKLVAGGRGGGSGDRSDVGVEDLVYAGTLETSAEDQRALGEVSRAIKTATYGSAGSMLGSSFGSYLANGNVGLGVVYSSVLGEIGERLAVSLSGTGSKNISNVEGAIATSFSQDVFARMKQAGVGAVSSMLGSGPIEVRHAI